MTKWKRLRKLREKKRFGAEALRPKAEGEEVKQTKPEKISKNIQQSQEIEKLDNTKNSKLITTLAQIPRYAYLLTIFALLTGVFFPANNTRGIFSSCYSRHCNIISWTSWQHIIIQSHNIRQ